MARWIVTIVIAVLIVGVLGSLIDPMLDFPGISPLVCSLHHGLWYGGGLLGPPGCYPLP